MNKKLFVLLIFAMGLLFTACGSSEGTIEIEKKIRLGEQDWDSARFHCSVAKYIIEKGYDYDVELVSGSSNNLNVAVNINDVDVLMEMWTDNYPEYESSIEAGTMVKLGVNFDDNMQGLYVPRYVVEGDESRGIKAVAPDLKTVDDLNKYPELFPDPADDSKGMIVNAPPSWIVSQIMEEKISLYDLDEKYNLFSPGATSSLFASLTGAYEAGEPWVGYMWEPTWISGGYDLIRLTENPFEEALWEDGYKCDFKAIPVEVIGSKMFVENHGEVADFLRNYHTSAEITAKALMYMKENDASIDEAAHKFLEENTEMWSTWLNEEAKNKVLESLK
ncbi:MAG: ABC transporter substrate-binding protein [Firmicutes bacterium]|nr:ABC transporter substrate-binding protein [Bacillota bacterium]